MASLFRSVTTKDEKDEKDLFDIIYPDDDSDKNESPAMLPPKKSIQDLVNETVKKSVSEEKPLNEDVVIAMIKTAMSFMPKPEAEKPVEKEPPKVETVVIKQDEESRMMIEELKEREAASKKIIDEFKNEIADLRKQVEGMPTAISRFTQSLGVRGGKIIPSLKNQGGKFLSNNGAKLSWATAGASSEADSVAYFGDRDTDGSWRIIISGSNLAAEKRESGVWVEKGRFEP